MKSAATSNSDRWWVLGIGALSMLAVVNTFINGHYQTIWKYGIWWASLAGLFGLGFFFLFFGQRSEGDRIAQRLGDHQIVSRIGLIILFPSLFYIITYVVIYCFGSVIDLIGQVTAGFCRLIAAPSIRP